MNGDPYNQPPKDRLANVELMPRWKRRATTPERLRELALFAEKNPELFDKWVLIYAEDNDQRFKVRYMSGPETRTSDSIGMCQAGALHIWDYTCRPSESTAPRDDEA